LQFINGAKEKICYFETVKIIKGVRNLKAPFLASALTIGNFDGVHLGHRALINHLVARARTLNVPAVVMTFEPHPVKVLYPARKLNRIFDFADQREQLALLGVDALVIEPFSREFSQLPPDRYLSEWIIDPFHPAALVVGYDFSFGANRLGSIAFLESHATQFNYSIEVVAPVQLEGVMVSSSQIRQALAAGNVSFANRLLTRSFYLKGLVEKGVGRGRTFGIRTANLRTFAETIPARGVYCGWAEVRGKRYPAMVNIGVNPTFTEDADQKLVIEAHLLGFDKDSSKESDADLDFYGEQMKLEFIDRLRDEKKFESKDDLVAQIRLDIIEGRRILNVE
jgi:riboflavin kinase/FMN adenylyltransferase